MSTTQINAIHINELKKKSAAELMAITKDMNIENMARATNSAMIVGIMTEYAKRNVEVYGDGVLEILTDGYGFLRSPESSFMPAPDDIYVSPSQIRKFGLRTGDMISGKIRPPKEGERYFALLQVKDINFDPPDKANKILFENRVPLFPN